jgi:eukaryotic-like serine/threonine-protein kinase
MECIDGETLSSILAREGKLALPHVVEVIKGICAGLTAAHSASIVHRDLKPDNVLMAKDGRPVITDFGIARERATSDQSGVITGTPEYMAPEQVEAAVDLDARADIYALGVMLYEMVTARRPWSRSTPLDTALARLYEPPPDPLHDRPDLPAALARIVMRCMAQNRDDRYSSAVEVVAELSLVAMTTFGVAPAFAAPSSSARTAKEKTLAVLPFRNIGNAQDDFAAVGFWEDVLDALSMTKGIKVKPRSVVAKFKDVEREPREIGEEIGVQVVVEGSLRRTSRGFRISTRAISVGDDFQLWAGRFDKPEEDLLVVGDEVAKAIAGAVTAELSAPAREPVTDARAIELYLRAREEYRKYWAEPVKNSLGLFERALEIAPNDPTILAGYAMAWSRLGFFIEGITTQARDAALRAVQAAPHVGGPYVALGYAHLQAANTADALRSCKVAIQKAPGLAEGYAVLGMILSETGPMDDAQTWSEAAISHDVNVQFGLNTLARIHAFRGRWQLIDQLFARVSGAANMRTARLRFALWQKDVALAEKYKDEIIEMNPANRLLLGIARVMLERRAAHGA